MHGMEYGGSTSVPAFLAKLWTLVEDESTDDIIAWDQSGSSFHIFDQIRLAKEVLPVYFKHNNMASFVRQLNMYGFRKILQVDHGGIKVENDTMEFAHPFFQKGRDYLLDKIKRKVSNPVQAKTEERSYSTEDIHRILGDVHVLKNKTETVSSQFDGLKRENDALWREVAVLRQKHIKQQSVVNKLVQFLVSVCGARGMPNMKRKLIPIMLGGQQEQGPSRAPKVSRQYRPAESPHAYKVEQPRTPLSTNPKGVTIEEVFDDSQEYVNVGDFSDHNIVLEGRSPENMMTSNLQNTSSGGNYTASNVKMENIKMEDLLDDPTIMENVAQGIRSFSAETTSQKNNSNVPIVTVQNPIRTQPVTVNIPGVTTVNDTTAPCLKQQAGMTVSQGKQSKQAEGKQNRRKSSGLKVQMPTAAAAKSLNPSEMAVSQQVAMLPSNMAHEDALAQMTMTLPTSGMVNDVGDNLDTIDYDLESLKELLSEGYNIDTNTLMGLFNPEGPVPSTPEHLLSLDENPIRLESGDVAGNELIHYNPPEDLATIFDLQDITPVTDADGDLNDQTLENELNTPLVTPLDGDMRKIPSDIDITGFMAGKMGKGKNLNRGIKIKKEMEELD